MTIDALADVLLKYGANAVLVVVVVLILRGDLVPGWALRREREFTDLILPLAQASAEQLKVVVEWIRTQSGPSRSER